MPASNRQLEIDWDRGRQLALLRDCKLPDSLLSHDNRRVSKATAKLLLHLIDHHARGRTCFVSVETLAELAGRAPRTVIRATQALEALSVLIVQTDGRRRCNRYTIVWSELALLCQSNTPPAGDQRQSSRPYPECHLAPESSDTRAESSDTRAESSDTRAESSDTGVTLTAFRSAKEPPPPSPHRPNCAPTVTWEEAAAELAALGVEHVEGALSNCRRRGLSPGALLDACRTGIANCSRFGSLPAAVVTWCRVGAWPAPHVRPWQEIAERQTAAAVQAAEARRTRSNHESEAHDYRREFARLQTAYGKQLDDMPRDAIEQLIDSLNWTPFQRENWRRNPKGAGRCDLLRALEQRQVETMVH